MFITTVKEWKHEWFHIIELLAPSQTEVPAFLTGPPKKLKSWKEKRFVWGNPEEVEAMIKRIKWWSTSRNIQLADIVNVMLNCHILPLLLRATPMWEQKPEDAGPITAFFRSTLAGMWTRLLKLAKNNIPEEGEDLIFEDGYEAPQEIL